MTTTEAAMRKASRAVVDRWDEWLSSDELFPEPHYDDLMEAIEALRATVYDTTEAT